jgi:FtsH-binding integral membrane protein
LQQNSNIYFIGYDPQSAPVPEPGTIPMGGNQPNYGFAANDDNYDPKQNIIQRPISIAPNNINRAQMDANNPDRVNPDQVQIAAYNPYPNRVDPQVQRAVEGEKQWQVPTCLDCVTKLRGNYEQQAFVRKVFGILTAQTLFTVFICGIVFAWKDLEDWLQHNLWFYYVCLAITICLIIVLVCFRKPARKVPINYILLFTFTFFESLMLATFSSFYNAESIFLAAVMTLTLFTTMTVIALFTSRKPHTLAMMMYVCCMLSIVSIFFLIFFTSRYVIIVVMAVMLVVACVYVMIDIDLITEKHGLGYDEYIVGALFLYMDIVMIFTYVLAIFGERG